jgi:hypothetical protein
VAPERRESHAAPQEIAVAPNHVGVAQIPSRSGIAFEHQTMRVGRDRHELVAATAQVATELDQSDVYGARGQAQTPSSALKRSSCR